MKFLQNKIEIKTLVIKNFFNNVINFIFGEIVIHNSHVSSDIIGYAHDFYYRKLKENQKTNTRICSLPVKLQALCLENKMSSVEHT